MTRYGAGAGEVDLGVLYSDAWRALRANASAFAGATLLSGLALIVCALPAGAVLWAEEEGALDPALGLAGEYVAHALVALASQWLLLGGLRMSLAALRGHAVEATHVFDAGGAFVPGLIAGLVVNFIIGTGVLMCVVPGVLWACSTALTPLFVVDKGLHSVAAVRASFAATRGRRFTVFAYYLSSYVVLFLGALTLGVGLLAAIPFLGLALAAMYERTWPAARPDA